MKRSRKFTHKTESEIRKLLSLQQNYEGTVKDFCKTQNIHKATFYNWRQRFGVQPDATSRFVPLQLPVMPTRQERVFAEIELSSQVVIRLFEQVDASYFKSLL